MCCFSLFVIHIQHLLFWLQVLKKSFHYQLGYFFFNVFIQGFDKKITLSSSNTKIILITSSKSLDLYKIRSFEFDFDHFFKCTYV